MVRRSGRSLGVTARRAIVAFLLGLLCGSAAIAPVAGREVERLRIEREQILLRLVEERSRAERLSSSLDELRTRASRASPVVERIELKGRIPEPADRVEIEESLSKLLGNLIGRETSGIDPVLLYLTLQDRIVTLEDDAYVLDIKAVLVGRTLTVYYDASPEPPRGSPENG